LKQRTVHKYFLFIIVSCFPTASRIMLVLSVITLLRLNYVTANKGIWLGLMIAASGKDCNANFTGEVVYTM